MTTHLLVGAPVVFVAGKYKNKGLTGTVDRLTACQVVITVDGSGRTVRVNQTSVVVLESPLVAHSSVRSIEDFSRSAPRSHVPAENLASRGMSSPVDGPVSVSPSPQSSSSIDDQDYVVIDIENKEWQRSSHIQPLVHAVSDEEPIGVSSPSEEIFEDALTSDDDVGESFEHPVSFEENGLSQDFAGERFEDAISGERGIPDFVAVVTDHQDFFDDAMANLEENHETIGEQRWTIQTRSSQRMTNSFHVAALHRIMGLEIRSISLLLPGQTTNLHRTYGHHLFGNRILPFEFNMSSIPPNTVLPVSFVWHGRTYQVLSCKIQNPKFPKGGDRRFHRPPSMTASMQYVATSGENLSTLDLQQTLNEMGNFAALTSCKAASRLELFCSPARMSNRKDRKWLIFDDLTCSDFDVISGGNECGFIPRRYIQRFLGNRAVGKRTHSLQIRLFAPKLGIYKGMLSEKPSIDKIQLPAGMAKVGPSLLGGQCDDWLCLVITSIDPNSTNVNINKLLQGEERPKSFVPKQPSSMVTCLWQGLGVPRNVIERYISDISDDKRKLQHAFVVGVADPTASLPEGHVFITGLKKNGVHRDELFVTRCPCMERSDGRMLPAVVTKPRGMTDAQWSWLNCLDFGSIVFANSCDGRRPLPELIANGDLDGDLYFVCWNTTILSNMQYAQPVDLCQADGPSPMMEASETVPPSVRWFEEIQKSIVDLRSMVEQNKLIGKLYSQSVAVANGSIEGINDPDAIRFGRACKDAIDIRKHGGKVFLPRHLWSLVPDGLHTYLDDGQETSDDRSTRVL